MQRADAFLDAEARAAVEDAVRRVEARTAAEVACVVATESGRYDRAESLVGLALALAGLGLAPWLWAAAHGPGTWGLETPVWVQALGAVLGFLLGSVLASYVHPLRHLLVSRAEQEAEVARGAAAAFTRLQVGTTRARTGVLIYLSLAEHQVVVLLDQVAREAAGEGFAEELCRAATEGLAAGRGAAVLVELVERVGERLEGPLPRQGDDADELSDRVVVLHPR